MARRPSPPSTQRRPERPSAPPIPMPSARRGSDPEDRTVVHASDRFRRAVRGRPWRRHRRRITLGVLAAVVLAVGLLVAAVFLPALQVRDVEVAGLGYVDEVAVQEAAAESATGSVLLLPGGRISAAVEEVPGVASAEVERAWPDGARITVTESEPLAEVDTGGEESRIVDAGGTELPAAAGEDAHLVSLRVGEDTSDEDGSIAAMLEVLDTLPADMREDLVSISATTPSDVTLVANTDDGEKTIVWGDATDSDLKAEVTQVLLTRPGDEIDVSSPVAPVTR